MPIAPPPPHRALLVVDDDPAIREAIPAALRERYRVYTAATGPEACAVLRGHPVSAILLDVRLGTEDGLEWIGDFRALSAAPIVILTGHSTEELAVRALQAQVAEYLRKPVGLPALQAALDRLNPGAPPETDVAATARRLLDAHPPAPFAPTSLATQVRTSEGQLRRAFRTAYGQTPKRYLVTLRLRRAAQLLGTTRFNVAQIGYAVGFASAPWFTKLFTRTFGVSPLGYRKTQRDE